MSRFTERDLNIIASDFATRYFEMKFNISVKINGRKNGSGLGAFRHKVKIKQSVRLEFSKRYVEQYCDENVIDVLLHELSHWYCYESDKPYKDGDSYFENQLRRVGATSTNVVLHAGDMYVLLCEKCNQKVGEVNSVRKLSKYIRGYTKGKRRTVNHVTYCCNAGFKQGGVYRVEDKYVANEKIKEATEIAFKLILNQKQERTIVFETPKVERRIQVAMTQTTTVGTPLISSGKRGVTNAQMIPAIEQAVKDNDKKALIELQVAYPVVFESSRKYVKKSLAFRFVQLMEA
ncbi:hypothetical protein D3C71_945430 [compost metagenome]